MLTAKYPSNLEYQTIESPAFGEQADCLMVLCHGFGAPGSDLIPIADEVMNSIAGSVTRSKTDESGAETTHTMPNVRIVVPSAPLKLEEIPGYEARAWWPLNMEKLQEAIGSGDLATLANSIPPGIEHANRLLTDLIFAQLDELNLPLSKIVLAGFSQGAMLSTDVALRLNERVGALVIFSGTTICMEQWKALAHEKSGLQVFQTHGTMDPILPIAGARLLAEILKDAGMENQYGEFNGPHTIPMSAIDELARIVEAVARK